MRTQYAHVGFACLILAIGSVSHAVDPLSPLPLSSNFGDSNELSGRVDVDLDADLNHDSTVEDSEKTDAVAPGLWVATGTEQKITMIGTPNVNVGGSVVLEATTSGGGDVRVWDYTAGPTLTPIIDTDTADSSQSWTLTDTFRPTSLASQVLYVEGTNVSTAAGDVTLTLKYKDANGATLRSDTVLVTVTMNVALTVRTGDDKVTDGTDKDGNPDPGQPNSNEKLGLWDHQIAGKLDMKVRCTNHNTGDKVNGGASYTGAHPYTTGTCLKAGIYAHIVDRGDVPDATVETPGNWRVVQQKTGWTLENGAYVRRWIEWVPDFSYQGPVTAIQCAAFDLEHDYLYVEDAPGFRNVEPATLTADGNLTFFFHDFRTWVEFKCGGTWIRVTDYSRWGCLAVITKVDGALEITREARAK